MKVKFEKNPDIMNTQEAAAWVGLNVRQFNQLVRDGVFPSVTLCGKKMYSRNMIDGIIYDRMKQE